MPLYLFTTLTEDQVKNLLRQFLCQATRQELGPENIYLHDSDTLEELAATMKERWRPHPSTGNVPERGRLHGD